MEKEIGKVVHYFDHVQAAVVALTADLKIGDTVKFVRHDEEVFHQKVESMQIEHKAVTEAKAGEETAIKVEHKVKQGTIVYKIEE
ncbi:MAG: hypothetical protein A3H02_01585 [Candidatus Niyogibacteria bacterium RIFCSPLOWO2_12_FULL_41_13]|uniref:Translation elongation factor-like protein n=1 Tax=Candidatus Niyogibacteria bacterium RIFCSPLOWO2_12_FULL_41_13 TaxID=1801726 RepID=A0A1G2F2C1_9BACT|nr:MAG: hypothetical protein A3H02_01585 [Candidatus Niyogibacteria bacterium RIFCSPLOWO2_12_FULL_41_13]